MRIGRYEIVNELGRGAMGIVYRADDPVIGRTVAIKTIKLGDITDPQEHQRLRDRLFREARSAGILSHPNIVTVFDIGEQGETAYIAMEFVSGNTLEPMMRSGAEKHVILSVIYETAAALDYAHSKGIVHRDVKPANIMINENGAVKITDFGIAKILSQQVTQADLVLGTPSYMSPEQIEAKSLDGRSDQFALAVIAYEMLTGEKPFAADSLPSLLFKIVKEEQLAAHHLNPTLGLETGAVLAKALSKKNADRYATCSEFAQALTDSLNLHPAWRPLMRGAASSMATIFEPAPEFTRLETTVGSSSESPSASPELPADLSEAPTQPVALPIPPTQLAPPPPVAPPVARPEIPRVPPPAESIMPPPVQPTPTETPSTPWERREVPAPPPSVSIKNLVLAVLVIVLFVGAWYAFRTFTSSGSKQIATADTPVVPPEKKDVPVPKVDPPKNDSPIVDPQPPGGSTQPGAGVPPADPKSPGTTKPGTGTRLVFVEIESDPPGAKVSIDPGTEAATGCDTPCPLQLPPGRHVMQVSLAGYRNTSRIFTLPQEAQQKVKLERQSGILSIRSTPGEAQILINGQAHAQATPAIVTLPVGKYKIELRKQGFVTWDEEIEVRDQVNSTITVTLPPNG